MKAYIQKAEVQFGTVGSGNHYVDLMHDEHGFVWIGVHFGSRGLGHTSATRLSCVENSFRSSRRWCCLGSWGRKMSAIRRRGYFSNNSVARAKIDPHNPTAR